MSEPQHTPGPWAVSNVDFEDLKGVDEIVSVPTKIRVIMPGSIWGCSQDECDANARLIAAAPELLRALRRCAAEMKAMHSHYHPTCEGDCPYDEAHSAALQAVTKAVQA